MLSIRRGVAEDAKKEIWAVYLIGILIVVFGLSSGSQMILSLCCDEDIEPWRGLVFLGHVSNLRTPKPAYVQRLSSSKSACAGNG